MLFDLAFQVDWDKIKQKRSQAIATSNKHENAERIQHQCRVGDQVLVSHDVVQRKLLPFQDGPFCILKIYLNGIAKIGKGIVSQWLSVQ